MAGMLWEVDVRILFELGIVFLNIILPNFQFGWGQKSIDLWIGEFVLPWHRVRFLALFATISEQPLVALQKSRHDKKAHCYQAQSGS